MSCLISSDLHLTDRDRDSYRWELFPWLEEKVEEHKVTHLFFLGDTTDAKDKHSAKLTNRIVDTFTSLSKVVEKLYILRGNHDYINEATPFFRFLNHIPGINFVIESFRTVAIGDRVASLVPNTKDFAEVVAQANKENWDFLFCHQTFKGAKVENNTEMEGLDAHMFDEHRGVVISGDVHVPQVLGGKIVYVGAPYPIHYGDNFPPRVILLDDNYEMHSIPFRTLKKHAIDIVSPEELKRVSFTKGDQVKVRLVLDNPLDWEEYKKEVTDFCKEHSLDLSEVKLAKKTLTATTQAQESTLRSLTPKEIFQKFCEASNTVEAVRPYGEGIVVNQLDDSTKGIST